MDPKEFVKNIFLEALEYCSPSQAIHESMRLADERLIINEQKFDLEDRPIYLFAVGKAAIPMFNAAQKILANHISGSLVITSDDEQADSCSADEVLVGNHPTPGKDSMAAGKRAVQFLRDIPGNALVLTLISGGTSSLMCLPPEEVSISDINRTYELLNNSGATIREINTVRKHCSQIKGGQLLEYLNPNITLIDLVISDVPDDDLSIIGSGPTTTDLSTFQDAYHLLLEYDLWDDLSPNVQQHFELGIDGQVIESVKPREDPMKDHYSWIISSAEKLANKIFELATQKGVNSQLAKSAFNDDVENVAALVADKVLSIDVETDEKPHLFIFYGESTVEVTGRGKGGRNQELALRGALKIAGQKTIAWLSAGTDGIDGPTDAAGAIVDSHTISEAVEQGLDPQKYLAENDAYHFHEQMGTLLKTGPTGNNLMDVVLALRSD